jgi:hypothetical protein
MWVERVEPGDPVLDAARRLSARSADECVSARELAADLSIDESDALSELDRLQDTDWVVRYEDNLTAPAESRWVVRVHGGLTLGRRYEVLGIEADDYRLLNDCDDPVLYDPSCFRIVDDAEPEFWVDQRGDENERYAGPKDWLVPGFFEDYHDRDGAVRDKFWNDLSQLYPGTWKERRTAG